jgi:4-hydroxymandelate oxidase
MDALERRARDVLPRPVYDYYATGSGREVTLRANLRAWRQVPLLPRVLRDVSAVDLSADWLGTRVPVPIGIAPTAMHCLAHPSAEIGTATGAARAGALYVVSFRCTRRLEDIAAALDGAPWWFQVYVLRDRSITEALVRRAVAAGARALVLTGDTPVPGWKRRDRSALPTPDDFYVNLPPGRPDEAYGQTMDLTFDDISWLWSVGGGVPVLVKGVLRPDDAVACVAHGAAGVIVSNHGGRQLDGAIPSAVALPSVVAALGPEAEVYVDGGLRSASDVLVALALGARGVFLGRPVLWALACGGADGVAQLLTGLTGTLEHVMAVAGVTSIAEVPGISPTRAERRTLEG